MSISNSVVKRGLAPPTPTARGALLAAAVGLALACPSALAQVPELPELHELPRSDQASVTDVGNEVVKDVVNDPLPTPVEKVVENSPVAPVRDEVSASWARQTSTRAARDLQV